MAKLYLYCMNAGHTSKFLLIILFLSFSTISPARSADAIDELKACARIDDRDSRCDCYETMGKRVLDAETAADNSITPPGRIASEATPAVVASTKVTQGLPDGMGGAEFEAKPDPADGQIQGRINACKQGVDRRWHFFFENGQVWKQVNVARLVFRECDFMATITKDGFGYKMQVEGRKRKIRVSRRK